MAVNEISKDTNEETVDLRITLVSCFHGPKVKTKKTITKKKYKELCLKYGTYGFSWYFTEYGIKYFDGEWHYE
ncbi:MAG: hypothetical protein ACP5D6_06420 [Kosmotogaceae bacterium]